MTKQFRVVLPVKPHIRKFLHCHYGYPVKLTHQHKLGTILLALLENQNSSGLNLLDKEKRRKRLTATVECFAAMHRLAGKGVSDDQIININRLLEAEFEIALHNYVQNHTGPKGRYVGYMEALRGFMEEYHICDELDMPIDSLKKLEYRYRQKLERAKKEFLSVEQKN